MEIRHLRYFLAVARELNFTKAADVLRMSLPPLSQRIKALERELGAPLFDRSTHHTRLTSAGEALLPVAARLVAEFDELPALVRRRAVSMEVRVAIPDSLNPYHRTQIAATNRDLAGEYRIAVRQKPSLAMEAELLDKRIDIAFSRVPAADVTLGTTLLYTEALVVVLDATHFPGRESLQVKDLQGFTYLLGPKHWELSARTRQSVADRGILTDPDLRFSDSGGMLLLLANEKRFAALAPASDFLRNVDPNAFAILPVTDIDMTMSTYLIRRTSDTRTSPVVDAYLSHSPPPSTATPAAD
ncbi:LysR family transcriptional regulator [Nocardia transvalensis]|uniref:LysR family transcriptional regulator n=1 Tax=Nocardia transvalensis TaxID=37333 RepID=UPI001893CC84|nr:LysR family transcriptional regulator [Nocardia transvalensis]MBF6328187.1 LysR family transcriptional regulator [Nocardia transvalensis]